MQQLLTGQTRLPGFHGDWEVKRLGDLLTVRHGKSQHDITAPDGKYPILASGGEIGRTNTFIYDKPSVLIGRKGTIDSPQYAVVPALIKKWERKLQVKVAGYYLQRMKTKWGSCNHKAGNIRLNTELIKKPKDLLEYVIVHEMVHLLEPTHNERFISILGEHFPTWREARAELNELPLAAEVWRE